MSDKPKTTVLLVDDRKESLSVLVDVLSRAGFRVLVAEDGEAGVQQAQRARPDVILLDITMPVLDGYGCCRQLKQHEATKDIPVIFMSAKHETVDRVRGFAAGGVDHVTKPFRAEEVLARVSVHAQLHKLTKNVELAKAALKDAPASDAVTRALAALNN